MTSEEFQKLAAGLKAVYTSESFLPDEYSMGVWFRLLKDIDYKVAETAAYKHICTNKFPPTIAEIREAAQAVVMEDRKNWLEGWGMVNRAIGKYGFYRPQEAIEALTAFDPITGKVAKLMGWQNLCTSEDQTADRANFRKAYEAIQSREIETAKLPPVVSRRIDALTRGFALKAKDSMSLPTRTA